MARPFVLAHIVIPSKGISDDVNLLVDTGADGTLLSPSDATRLRLNLPQLPPGPPSTGVGGRLPTVYAQASLTIDSFIYQLPVRILAPRSRVQQQALAHIPSTPRARHPGPLCAVLRGADRSRATPHPAGGRRALHLPH